jgi:hypothetical protein
MIRTYGKSRRLGLTVAIATLVCAAGLFSISLMNPKPTPDPGLGAGWQCSKTAGMLTVCTKVAQTHPTSVTPRNVPERSQRA